jgi:SAM-dependent methyltransferase
MTESDQVRQHLRAYWDRDSRTYDDADSHWPRSPVVNAAWRGALLRLLPPAPARVLDVGAGTGFLSLNLARLGYQVTAVDSAAGMLERLRAKGEDLGVDVQVVEADAAQPPPGPFDAVVQRHLIWTLPDPAAALAAWRQAAPEGRLVLLESVWGGAADLPERLRGKARETLRTLRGRPGDHHAAYEPGWHDVLPLGSGTAPDRLTELVTESPWGPARLYRLRDVEWATSSTLPPWERLFGVSPRFAVVAGS